MPQTFILTNRATVGNYMSILGDDSETQSVRGVSENEGEEEHEHEETECLATFEDVAVVQDALLNDSSDSDNEVVRTNQLRLRPRRKHRPTQNFGDVAILLRRKYKQDATNELKETGRRLEIQSWTLQNDLRQLIQDRNDGINWESNPIKIEVPYYTLFFNRQKIEAFTSGAAPFENKERMRLVLDFIHGDVGHKTALEQYEQYVQNGKTTFDILWTIYTPNCIFIHNIDDIQECVRCIGSPTLFTPESGPKYYEITVENLDFDGTHVGTRRQTLRLESFSGVKEISSLTLTPLKGHLRESEIERHMTHRSDQFWNLIQADHSHKFAKCWAWIMSGEEEKLTLKRGFQVNGRVVIDYVAYLNRFPDHRRCLVERIGHHSTSLQSVPESLRMLCPARIPGFSLRQQRWGWLHIDEPQLSNITWRDDSFHHLVMNEHQKKLIQTLIRGHLKEGGFQTVVDGKGSGLIMLLHGPPGLGKTLLAESLSEHFQRPLYRATAGSLTLDPSYLEQELEDLFELGKRWEALVLLDEAEVLMTSRTTGNLALNAVVAAFLRVLEYYEGILFLTTNKPTEFDEAIRNRIHLEVGFDPITPEARRIIWRDTLDRASCKDDREGLWTDDLLDALSEVEMNGREINNIMSLAACYASGDNLSLNPGHLVNIIRFKSSGSLGKLDGWLGKSY